jgi:hypothetical protein
VPAAVSGPRSDRSAAPKRVRGRLPRVRKRGHRLRSGGYCTRRRRLLLNGVEQLVHSFLFTACFFILKFKKLKKITIKMANKKGK